jgi:hypothetical protein
VGCGVGTGDGEGVGEGVGVGVGTGVGTGVGFGVGANTLDQHRNLLLNRPLPVIWDEKKVQLSALLLYVKPKQLFAAHKGWQSLANLILSG